MPARETAGLMYCFVDEQQVVERQIKRLAQSQDNRFLGLAQRRMQGMGTVRTILDIVASQPLLCSGSRDVENLGRFLGRQAGILDFLADLRCGTGLRINA